MRVVVPHFADALERLVIRKYAILRAPKVASKAFDGSDDAPSFEVERSPVPQGIEGSAADIRNGPHSTVRLLLFKRSAKTVDVAVAVHEERAQLLPGSTVGAPRRAGTKRASSESSGGEGQASARPWLPQRRGVNP